MPAELAAEATLSGDKFTVALLFALIGLPPGLCSILETPEILTLARGRSAEASFYAALFGVFWLIGIAIFLAMLGLLLKTWRRNGASGKGR